jgi:hypothetical protein
MSDELKRIYAQEGKLHNFFEVVIPTDLFRGRKGSCSLPFMLPTLLGWSKPRPRPPDVLLVDSEGGSPQYEGDNGLVSEDRETMPKTAELVDSASRYTVKGCRSTYPGKHRGVSTFDRVHQGLRGFRWIKLPTGTPIPPGLAVTRDFDATRANPTSTDPRHYTIAPKNDMPLSLFLAHLRGLEATALDV